MSSVETYVAIDLGAESGRVMTGALADGCLQLEEVHRFPNSPVRVLDSLHWNVLFLWQEIKRGLARAAVQRGPTLSGIGVDSWAVDFALLDQDGALLGLPYHYRDTRTDGILEELGRAISERELYALTGLSFMSITTLSQLLAMQRASAPSLDAANALLLMADLVLFWLSGRQASEATIAGMTQLCELATGNWSISLLDTLGLPANLLRQIVPSATILDDLLPSVATETGIKNAPVIAAAGHDTAAAVAAVPSIEDHPTFISSGTWSVIGTELEQPLVSDEALSSGFLNEVGAAEKIFFAHNSTGLWPLQECRREWQRGGHNWSYAELTEMAARACPFAAVISPDDPTFAAAGDMQPKIADYCQRTGQDAPASVGSTARCLLEGLALRYRKALADLERLTGRPCRAVHVVGGGSRNRLLCQFTANATGRPVIAGPSEATAMGNILLQALAQRSLGSIREVREVVRRSTELKAYEPHPSSAWDDAYGAFLQISQMV